MTQGPVRLDVSVGYALPRAGVPAAVSFRKWVAAALAGRIREADLAIRLVDAKEGRALNRHYRGRDYATNVLSFPADLPEGALVLLCEGVEKPGNLGAMLRTADAAGVALVIAADPVTDWGNPNVIRSSKGTVFSVPVASASTEEAWSWLAGRGVAVVATTPDTDIDHTDADLTGAVAVAVGSEKYGLTDAALARAQHRVRIPMVGRANSLNVATSAAIVVYEAVRQRRSRCCLLYTSPSPRELPTSRMPSSA